MARHTHDGQKIRVLGVDDHALFRAGVGRLLEDHGCLQVVADCGSAKEGCALAAREQPEVILLDLDLGLGPRHGLGAIPDLLDAAPDAAILAITRDFDKELHEAAILRGARGVVTKNIPPTLLLKAVERLSAGELWVDRAEVRGLLASVRAAGRTKPGPGVPLTKRERQIIAVICEGLDNRQIGTRLQLSAKTVSNHLSSIFSKLGVSGRLGLAILAFGQGLDRIPRPHDLTE